MDKVVLNIEGMGCDKCVTRIANGLNNETGVKKVEVSLSNKQAIIEGDNLNKEKLVKIVEDLGYKVNN